MDLTNHDKTFKFSLNTKNEGHLERNFRRRKFGVQKGWCYFYELIFNAIYKRFDSLKLH